MTAQPKAVPPIPEGCSTVMPWIISRDTARLLDFLIQAFGAQELSRLSHADGTITHAEARIGDSIVGVFDTREGWPETPCFLAPFVVQHQPPKERHSDVTRARTPDRTAATICLQRVKRTK